MIPEVKWPPQTGSEMASSQEVSHEEPDVEAFGAELRAWLAEHLTPEVVEAGERATEDGTLGLMRAWNRTLADGGWAAPAWPSEYGGATPAWPSSSSTSRR